MEPHGLPWQVLLIGGVSGSGKTIIAEEIGKQHGIPWLQVDDLRLALQFGGLVTPEQHPDLFYFLRIEDRGENLGSIATEVLLEKQIRIAQDISPAINVVIDHHVATGKPIILEGDGILPTLAAERCNGIVRAVFLSESDEQRLYRNMMTRGRGIASDQTSAPSTEEKQRHWIRHVGRYNQWLENEARRQMLPVVQSHPWDTLLGRILAAIAR